MKHSIKHLGIIPDGNRRWAKSLGKNPWDGHREGIQRFSDAIDWYIELKIPEVTFYTLSMQNFKREELELKFLYALFKSTFKRWFEDQSFKKRNIRVRACGHFTMLPRDVQTQLQTLVEQTKENSLLTVNLAIGYGGREEVINAVQTIVKEKGEISEQNINNHLWIQSFPDLVIRTSGEQRTSNFLMWQTIYSEWFFTMLKWPEFSKEELLKAIDSYETRERRYGK